MARRCTPRHDLGGGAGRVLRQSPCVAGRPVGPAAGRRPGAPDRFGTAMRAERPRTASRGARGDVQGAWRGAVLAVGRRLARLAPRATGAAVDGGLRALRRSPDVARVRRCVSRRAWKYCAMHRQLSVLRRKPEERERSGHVGLFRSERRVREHIRRSISTQYGEFASQRDSRRRQWRQKRLRQERRDAVGSAPAALGLGEGAHRPWQSG